MKVVIHRFEGFYAVCRDSNQMAMDIKRIMLPPGAKEGDTLNINDGKITLEKQLVQNIGDMS